MAGAEQFLLEGGMSQPTLAAVASGGYGIKQSGIGAHHSVLALLLVAVAGLYLLDKFGFRFAVSTGRR